MSPDNWEQIHYHQLPDWMKKVADSGQRNTGTRTKVFPGIPYDYKVEYTVNRDVVSISYWRSAHPEKPVKFRKPGFLVLVLLGCFLAAAVSYAVLPQFFVPGGSSSDTRDSLAGKSDVTAMNITAAPTHNGTTQPETDPDTRLLLSPKILSYYYYIDNSRKSISLTMYGGVSQYLSEERRLSPTGSDKEVITALLANQYQDKYLQPLLESLAKRSPARDDPAKIAISLVQHIPFTRNQPSNAASDWQYPYETLYRNAGTSSDKSILAAYLLKELGYDAVLFEYPGAMAVGVKCSSDYDFYNTGYAFIETSVPTIITYVPESRDSGFGVSAKPGIIYVSEGKRAMDVSPEYRDASRLKQLERLGGVLDQNQYMELLKISGKYDLQRSR